MERAVLALFFAVGALLGGAAGHGRLMDPPGRSSIWRYNVPAPKNYNDHELNCGGFKAQYNSVNQGRCGECGDEWSLARPRPNDEGGLYGIGLIGQTYTPGQVVRMQVDLTAGHLGYFEFRLCPKSSSQELVTQACFDQHLLRLLDNSTRYHVTDNNQYYHFVMVRIPEDITCDYCVIQWKYTAGNNNWSLCEETPSGYHCGNQETFVNCADVSIKRNTS